MPQERRDARRFPMGCRAGSSLLPCCSLNQFHTAAQAISKSKVMLMSLSYLKPFNASSLSLGWSKGFVSVILGPEVQVSLILKGNPNKNLNKWCVKAIQEGTESGCFSLK